VSPKKRFGEFIGDAGKNQKTKSIAEVFKLVLPAVRRGLYVSGDGEAIAQ
jgi:hypothetical protein